MFTGHAEDFPRYKGSELSLGTCPLNEDFLVVAPFADCSFHRSIEGDLVTFYGSLVSKEPEGVITRRKPVNVNLFCTYNRLTKTVAQVGMAPQLGALGQEIVRKGDDVHMYLSLLEEEEAIPSGQVLYVQVGTVVHFEVGGWYLDQMKLNARATDCWTTPTPDPADTIRYDLSKDSCTLDDTFEVHNVGHGQRMHFESFAFSHEVRSHLYLHCNLVACDASEPSCGMCVENKKRKKRSLGTDYNIRAIVRVTKDIHMK
jgi:hypothetical protein